MRSMLMLTAHQLLVIVPLLLSLELSESLLSNYKIAFRNRSGKSPSSLFATPTTIALRGTRVLPTKVVLNGLQQLSNSSADAKVPAVYAILNNNYKSTDPAEGWGSVEYVSMTSDLLESLSKHVEEQGVTKVANVRALSFSFPQVTAMRQVVQQWKEQALAAGAVFSDGWSVEPIEFVDDDDDDAEEDEEWLVEQEVSQANIGNNDVVVSPFEEENLTSAVEASSPLEFTAANIDKVLDEIRPYLVADGGNVSVERVDERTKSIYLKLEGACGTCPSSTVTMQMGIERLLKEKFPDLGQVVKVEESGPTELTWEAVEAEIGRLKPAITAMGGVVKLSDIEVATGVVEVEFRGSNKVKQGLELALLDVPFVNCVKFIMG